MSMNEEPSPLGAAPDAVTPQTGDAAVDAADAAAADTAQEPSDTLSPAVRRLVRQFDLDVTGIHGTGPSGRIRVGDVIGLLEGRQDSGKRDIPVRAAAPGASDELAADPVEPVEPVDAVGPSLEPPAAVAAIAPVPQPPPAVERAAHAATPTTTVFDCDLSRVLAHRRKLRRDNVELLMTSYFVTALAAALEKAPELTAGELARFGVSLTTADGRLRGSVLAIPDTLPESLDERVRAVDIALRANLHTPLEHANLLVHHYGESGSVLATPTPLGAGHTASVGIGRVRREIAIRIVDGAETPRVTARCYLSLSFLLDRVQLHDANRALAAAVAILETWPELQA
jgi:2-oxoglutarate dehydrogenase E2 component (dihydrolipoamide succinyltransferase)